MNIIKGDLVQHLNSCQHFDAYAHQCNCFCRMGRGIAPLLAAQVKGLRDADNATCVGDRGKMGTFTFARHDNGAIVFNVYGQYHWSKYPVDPITGRLTDYNALGQGLFAVREALHQKQFVYNITHQMTLGIPLIGCGLAGGDWNVVENIVEETFDNSSVDVTLFLLSK